MQKLPKRDYPLLKSLNLDGATESCIVQIEELVDLLSKVAVNLKNLHIPVASNIVLQDRCELHPQGPYEHHGRPPRRTATVHY